MPLFLRWLIKKGLPRRFGQRPYRRDLICGEGFYGRLWHHYHRDALTNRIKDFESVTVLGVLAGQVFNYCCYVTFAQSLVRDVYL